MTCIYYCLEETHIIKQVGGSVRGPSFRHESRKRHPVQDLHEEVVLRQRPLTQEGSLRAGTNTFLSCSEWMHSLWETSDFVGRPCGSGSPVPDECGLCVDTSGNLGRVGQRATGKRPGSLYPKRKKKNIRVNLADK